ncbi:MAG: CoA-binding protein [Candidatus Aenigmarchaeota archaeon]|nr:CoA-binding protein [Candidatus Aenigmarchaeota archaeon]
MDTAQILRKYQIIAVIGCSRDVTKDAHTVPAYMKSKGYRIIPINPSGEEIMGQKSYKSMAEIPYDLKDRIEVVNIFRPSAELTGIVESILKEKANFPSLKVIWAQLGIQDDKAKLLAEKAGLIFIQNRCMMRDYQSKISFSV